MAGAATARSPELRTYWRAAQVLRCAGRHQVRTTDQLPETRHPPEVFAPSGGAQGATRCAGPRGDDAGGGHDRGRPPGVGGERPEVARVARQDDRVRSPHRERGHDGVDRGDRSRPESVRSRAGCRATCSSPSTTGQVLRNRLAAWSRRWSPVSDSARTTAGTSRAASAEPSASRLTPPESGTRVTRSRRACRRRRTPGRSGRGLGDLLRCARPPLGLHLGRPAVELGVLLDPHELLGQPRGGGGGHVEARRPRPGQQLVGDRRPAGLSSRRACPG